MEVRHQPHKAIEFGGKSPKLITKMVGTSNRPIESYKIPLMVDSGRCFVWGKPWDFI